MYGAWQSNPSSSSEAGEVPIAVTATKALIRSLPPDGFTLSPGERVGVRVGVNSKIELPLEMRVHSARMTACLPLHHGVEERAGERRNFFGTLDCLAPHDRLAHIGQRRVIVKNDHTVPLFHAELPPQSVKINRSWTRFHLVVQRLKDRRADRLVPGGQHPGQ